MTLSIEEIVRLFASKGSAWYGNEAVSQIEHACQTATLAEREGATRALAAASFLHDIGHLLAHKAHEICLDIDDCHEYTAMPFLRGVFSEEVLAPIRLHVDAKRCLCLTDSRYLEGLSPASKRSLEIQGGVFTRAEADRFLSLPYSDDALSLRRWDDRAKTPGEPTPDIDYFAQLLREVSLEPVPAE